MLKPKIIKRIAKAIGIKSQPCPSSGTYLPACMRGGGCITTVSL